MPRKEYTAEELYSKVFKNSSWATAKEINDVQVKKPDYRPEEVLLDILKRKIQTEQSAVRLFPMTKNLKQIYMWLKDDAMIAETDRKLQELDRAFMLQFDKKQDERLHKTADMIGIKKSDYLSMEKRAKEQLKQEAASSMTDDEFHAFVNEQCSRFSEEETKAEFRKFAEKTRMTYSDEVLSLKQDLLLTADSMLKSEEYHRGD